MRSQHYYELRNKGQVIVVTEREYKNLYAQFQRVFANAKPFVLDGAAPMTGNAVKRVNLLPIAAARNRRRPASER